MFFTELARWFFVEFTQFPRRLRAPLIPSISFAWSPFSGCDGFLWPGVLLVGSKAYNYLLSVSIPKNRSPDTACAMRLFDRFKETSHLQNDSFKVRSGHGGSTKIKPFTGRNCESLFRKITFPFNYSTPLMLPLQV